MSKMGLHDPLAYLKHKLWPKERSGVKMSIWLPFIKSQKSPWNTCVQVPSHISLESSLQHFFRPHLNRRFAQEVLALQNAWSLNFESFGTPKFELGNPKKKWHFDAAFVANHKEYYKVWAVVSLVSLCMLVACPCIKSVPIDALTNLLFGLSGLCE